MTEAMTHSHPRRIVSHHPWTATLGTAAISCVLAACGHTVIRSGASVGNVAQDLAAHSSVAAQSAEVCLLKGALSAQPGSADKSLTDACAPAQKTDLLWRRALQILSLYGSRLSGAASGEEAETSGKLEAALSGVNGADWSDAEDQAARDAVVQLVGQMSAPSATAKPDIAKIVQEAAPPVRTLCAGLASYFDAQLSELTTIRQDVDKKSTTRSIRRCGTYESKPICVADTVVDRMVYAEMFARAVAIENATYDAKDSTARFCAAHDKLAEAAQAGQLGKKETYAAVVEAVKAVPRTQPTWDVPEDAKASDAPKAAAAGKPAKK